MQAVAQYDTGSPDYKLGDSEIAYFSSEGEGGWRCKQQLSSRLKPGEYYTEPGTGWTFYDSKGDGPYSKTMVPVNNPFSTESFLRERCGQLEDWMEIPTFDDKKGLKKDGTVLVVTQTKQALTRLDNTFEMIISTLKEIFQKDYLKTVNRDIQSFNS